jgi:hypothetical protein
VGNAGRLIDCDSQHPLPAPAEQLDFNDFEAFRLRDTSGDLRHPGDDLFVHFACKSLANKKVGFRPLSRLDV